MLLQYVNEGLIVSNSIFVLEETSKLIFKVSQTMKEHYNIL